jgi:sortase A
MESSPLPGQPGNAVLSGHRTTYGRPFFDFDLLEIGDEIEVESAIGMHIYVVREIEVVQPTDVWVTNNRAGAWLTMTTCEPKFSARQRLVVWAEMVSGPNMEFAKLHKERFAGQL